MAVATAPVRFVLTAPLQAVVAADRAHIVRRAIWPADLPSDLRPAGAPSPSVQILSILHGRNSG